MTPIIIITIIVCILVSYSRRPGHKRMYRTIPFYQPKSFTDIINHQEIVRNKCSLSCSPVNIFTGWEVAHAYFTQNLSPLILINQMVEISGEVDFFFKKNKIKFGLTKYYIFVLLSFSLLF